MQEANSTVYLDNDLVHRARGGEISAFEELFARHHKRVYNIAFRMLNDESDAADATQEVFVRAYRALGSLAADAAFVTWLKTLSLNVCRDVIRKRGRTKTVSLDSTIECTDGSQVCMDIADWSGNPERALDGRHVQEAVQKAICTLSTDYREVVTLFYIDGASVEEISKATGSPVGTIKSRLSRARTELKRKLENLLRESGD